MGSAGLRRGVSHKRLSEPEPEPEPEPKSSLSLEIGAPLRRKDLGGVGPWEGQSSPPSGAGSGGGSPRSARIASQVRQPMALALLCLSLRQPAVCCENRLTTLRQCSSEV